MCIYNTISSHTDHFELQKKDSEESLLTYVNLFPKFSVDYTGSYFEIKINCLVAYQNQYSMITSWLYRL